MAMILEVVDARGGRVPMRLRLDALPLTVGRGFANDVILDDPYVDARHARIALDESGALVVEDLGSVNGLVAQGTPARRVQVAVGTGAEVRVGRTLLRFRDPDEPVPPALPDLPEPVAAPEPARPSGSRWTTSVWAQLAVSAAAVGAMAGTTWLENYQRSSASEVVSAGMGFVMLGAIWAGIWAVAGRVVVQRFRFFGHFAVASAALLAAIAVTTLNQWLTFFFPDNPVSGLVEIGVGVGLAAALVAGHLSLASSMPRRRRWRAGIITGAVMLGLGGVMTLVEDEGFSDVPQFAGVLKPVGPGWIPTAPVAEFGEEAAELREQVDELAREE